MNSDILSAVKQGYLLCWQERSYIIKLALIPIFIKLMNAIAVLYFELKPGNFGYALALLPSFVVTGWLIAQFLRTTLTGERWPIHFEGSVEKNFDFLMSRARGILACIITFTLIGMAEAGLLVFVVDLQQVTESQMNEGVYEGNPLMMVAGLVGIAAMIWAFRFLWIHIPMVILAPVSSFLKNIGGFMGSGPLIVAWLLCIMPPALFLAFISSFFIGLGGGETLMNTNSGIAMFVVLLNVCTETLTQLLSAVAITYLMKDFLIAHGATPIFSKDTDQEKP